MHRTTDVTAVRHARGTGTCTTICTRTSTGIECAFQRSTKRHVERSAVGVPACKDCCLAAWVVRRLVHIGAFSCATSHRETKSGTIQDPRREQACPQREVGTILRTPLTRMREGTGLLEIGLARSLLRAVHGSTPPRPEAHARLRPSAECRGGHCAE